MSDPALGLTMLGLIVLAIMMGFPTAFTLMGLGMVFGYLAFWAPGQHWYNNQIFDLMVQRTYGIMTNDVLLSIPLFVFMGYIFERAARVPARPRVARGDNPPGVRVLGERLRHRRRGRDPDGRDRDAPDAEGGLRREARLRRDHGGGGARAPVPALGGGGSAPPGW